MSSARGELAHTIRPAAGEPRGALVLMHGRGTDESDLKPLLDELDPRRELVGVTPRGPFSMLPGGQHWYGPVTRVGFPNPETFAASLEALSTLLEGLEHSTGVPLSQTVLGGFSQGAVMAYALGLGGGRPAPAGVLAISGFIPAVDGFQIAVPRSGFPVAIAHGTLDPVISIDFGRQARDRLVAEHAAVLFREAPVAHTIDRRVLGDLQRWLSETLTRARLSAAQT